MNRCNVQKTRILPSQVNLYNKITNKTCNKCKVTKDIDEFWVSRRIRSGEAYTLNACCIECCRTERRYYHQRRSLTIIYKQKAPLAAATRLLEQNPEALELLIKRYMDKYIPLLREVREEQYELFKYRSAKAIESEIQDQKALSAANALDA